MTAGIGIRAQVAARVLEDDYCLRLGQQVEVELMVTLNDDGQRHSPRYVEGTITTATPLVLVVASKQGRTVRVPWSAVALIRDAYEAAEHPANT